MSSRQIRFFLCDFHWGGCYKLNMTPDCELLRRYAGTHSEEAFAELVQRHVNLVYSAALRQVNGDAHLAQDVAQAVFTDLARKAGSLVRRETLTGWLYTSAHFAAAKAVRAENRRRDREEIFMREPISESAPDPGCAGGFAEARPDWNKLRPVLDEAMHELKEADREAILLRYFENRQFAEIGEKFGLNENAARMRVERALEKLRAVFLRRGIAATTALASVISANAVQIAPAGLAATLTSASLAGAGTGTLTLLKLMTMTKLKLGLSALVVAGATTALVVQHQTQEKLHAENESLQQQIAQLKTNNESLSNRLAAAGGSKSLSDDQMNELLKLRGEVGALKRQVGELGKIREENQQLQRQVTSGQNQTVQMTPDDLFKLQRIHTEDALKQVGIAMLLYALDHHGEFPTNFIQILKDELGGATNFPGNVPLNAFELVNVGAANQHYPQMIMLREKVARKMPNGEWEREYGLADGSVQMQYSQDGNFDAYEQQQQQYNPPPNQ